jgi:hypothetical protein
MASRDPIQIEADRATVAKLYRQGYRSAFEIAQKINEERENPKDYVTKAMVQTDINTIRERYKNQQIIDYEAYRNEHFANLLELKKLNIEAYKRSTKSKITIESVAVVDADRYDELRELGLQIQEGEDVLLREAKIKEEMRPEGNPAFLSNVFQIDDRIAKFVGIDQPSKTPLSDGQDSAMSPLDELLLDLDKDKAKLLKEGNRENLLNEAREEEEVAQEENGQNDTETD